MGEPVRILDLARAMIELSGLDPDRDIDIEIVGRRPGEKLHEELFNAYERPQPTTSAEKILLAEREPLAVRGRGVDVRRDRPAGARGRRGRAGREGLASCRPRCWGRVRRARAGRRGGGSGAGGRAGLSTASTPTAIAATCLPPRTLPRFMTHLLLALSLSNTFTKIGAIAAFVALVGIALLSLLVFSQARELKRLREWAGRAPERAADLEQRVSRRRGHARSAAAHRASSPCGPSRVPPPTSRRLPAQPPPWLLPQPRSPPARSPPPARSLRRAPCRCRRQGRSRPALHLSQVSPAPAQPPRAHRFPSRCLRRPRPLLPPSPGQARSPRRARRPVLARVPPPSRPGLPFDRPLPFSLDPPRLVAPARVSPRLVRRAPRRRWAALHRRRALRRRSHPPRAPRPGLLSRARPQRASPRLLPPRRAPPAQLPEHPARRTRLPRHPRRGARPRPPRQPVGIPARRPVPRPAHSPSVLRPRRPRAGVRGSCARAHVAPPPSCPPSPPARPHGCLR